MFLVGLFFLTSCSSLHTSSVSAPGIQTQIENFELEIDTSFSGTLDDYRDEALTPALIWELPGVSEISSFYSDNCSYLYLSIEIPELTNYGYRGHNYASYLAPEDIRELGGSRFAWEIIDYKGDGTPFFLLLASLPAGSKVNFSLELETWGKDKGSSNCAYGYGFAGNGEVSSRSFLSWVRPKHETPPSPPVLGAVWVTYAVGGQGQIPCARIEDSAIHRFDAFPTKVSGTFAINGITQDIHDGSTRSSRLVKSNLVAGECGDFVRSVLAELKFGNSVGVTPVAQMESESPYPETSGDQRNDQPQNPRIQGCTTRLLISEFDTSGCGLLTVEVFQYDLNTGGCNFLGYWSDFSGTRRVGLFEFCKNLSGAVVEGRRYNFYVRNSGPTSYKNAFGATQSALSFTVLAED
jgi:hypothetical protein